MAVMPSNGWTPHDTELPPAVSGEAAHGGPPPPAASDMGPPVTPHVQMSPPDDDDLGPCNFRWLFAGIDTLDLGVNVDWGLELFGLFEVLDHEATRHKEEKNPIWRTETFGEAQVFRTGRARKNYRWQIVTADGVMYLANHAQPNGYPNVYLSPSAKSLWLHGPVATAQSWQHVIEAMGGVVQGVQVSRADLAADFALPEPLSLDFLRRCRVCRSRQLTPVIHGDELRTAYVGSRGAPLTLRVYNKANAILATGRGAFMLPIWGGPAPAWRVEFQLRRQKLRDYDINTLDDLQQKAGGLWRYLTHDWFSLRIHDNKHTGRRTPHPWWAAVQNVEHAFGPACDLDRAMQRPPVLGADWLVSHLGGCLASYAAVIGKQTMQNAINALEDALGERYGKQGWDDRVSKARLRRQESPPVGETGGNDAPF